MTDQPADERHRQRDAQTKNQQIGQPEGRRTGRSREQRQNRSRTRQSVQRTDHRGGVLVSMPVSGRMSLRVRVRMPMCVRRQTGVLMEMDVLSIPGEIQEDVEPEPDHQQANSSFRKRTQVRREHPPQAKQSHPSNQQHETVTARPMQPRPNPSPRPVPVKSPLGDISRGVPGDSVGWTIGCKDRDRHDMIGVESMYEPQREGDPQPGTRLHQEVQKEGQFIERSHVESGLPPDHPPSRECITPGDYSGTQG